MGICRYCALAPAARGRELTDLPLSPTRSLLRAPSFSIGTSGRVLRPVPAPPPLPPPSPGVESSGRASRRPDHVSSPVCHPIFRAYHDMLKARSRRIPFIGVRVCPTSIYRRGVPRGTANVIRKGTRSGRELFASRLGKSSRCPSLAAGLESGKPNGAEPPENTNTGEGGSVPNHPGRPFFPPARRRENSRSVLRNSRLITNAINTRD